MICVTNRVQCTTDFCDQLEKIAYAKPETVILRERDLDVNEYEALASACLEILRPLKVELTIHTHVEVARRLQVSRIHMPLSKLSKLDGFTSVSSAVHSLEELAKASRLGVNFVIAGHIFQTDCKRGVPPRGIPFLREICDAAKIPVYAIGGITPENAPDVLQSGASGVCVMSALMKSDDPEALIQTYHASLVD